MGGMLGNKRQDRGKKNFRGPEILGGTFGGNAKKKGENFLGGVLGSCEPQQILGGEFFEKCQRKNLGGKILGEKRGDFLGGSYTGGSGKKKFQGARNFGGELLGEMQKKGGKLFGGSVGEL